MMMRTMRTIQAALLICALGSMLASAGTGNLLETWFGQKPAATKPRPTLVATKVRSADQKEPGIVRGMTPTKGRIDLSAIHAATDGEKSSKAVRPSSLREKLMNSMASEGLAPNPLHMDLKKIPKGPLLDFLDTDDDDTDSSNNYDDDDDSDDDEEDDDDSRGSTTKKKSKDKRKKKVKEKGKKKNKPAIWGSHSDTGGDETDDFDNDSDDDVRGRTSSSSGSESDDDDDTKADILVPREKYACTKTNNSPDDDARERLFEDIDFETVKKKKKTMTNADSEVGKKSKSGKAAKAGKTSAGKSAKASKVAKDDSEENEDEFEDEFEDDNADDNDNDNDDDEEEEDEEEDEKEEKKEPMEILRASAAVFSKGFKDVLKKTGKVALAAKEAAGEMTKKVSEEAVVLKSNLDRTLMVTDMGRILNLLAQVNHAARFVRLQFSKFTVIITPIIEESLDYLGDEGLDKLKWVDRDDMDLQREALLSLVFGYEFMRFMIIWREYLLLAHEAFRYWMENMKRKHEEYEAQLDSKKEEKGGESKKKAVPPLKRLRFSPASVHNYLLQLAWESMEFDLVEVRENLRFLLAKAKAERRDYENKFLRNLLIMRSYYEPMMEKIDEESSAMRSVTKDQVSTTKLFYKFRNGVANGELNADVFVPEPLTEFMAKMMPQLAYTRKIYSDAHFNNLRKKIEAARKRREALLQPVKERKRKKKPETGAASE